MSVGIGVGPVAADVADLVAARIGAERALRVARGRRGPAQVARIADVQAEALVLELRDAMAARGERPSGPLARLIAYDARYDAALVQTLRLWLDAFGDVRTAAAAAAAIVHQNTYRYRLRRVVEVGGIDLTDPDARFVAMLQLRVLWPEDCSPSALEPSPRSNSSPATPSTFTSLSSTSHQLPPSCPTPRATAAPSKRSGRPRAPTARPPQHSS